MLDNGSNSKCRFAPTGYPVSSLKIGNEIFLNERLAYDKIIENGYSEAQIKVASKYSGFKW